MSDIAPKFELINSTSLEQCRLVVKELMSKQRINATELARRIHLPQPTIHRLLVGKTEDPKLSTLMLLATYFSVSLDQLLGLVPLDDANGKKNTHSISVPIISWQDAITANEFTKNLNQNNWEEWFIVDIDASSKSFGLKTKRSMEPRFPMGSILTVDTDLEPSDGDLLIVQYPETTEATIRELIQDGPKRELHSLLESPAIDELKENIKIIGVVIQTRFAYKNA